MSKGKKLTWRRLRAGNYKTNYVTDLGYFWCVRVGREWCLRFCAPNDTLPWRVGGPLHPTLRAAMKVAAKLARRSYPLRWEDGVWV